MPVVRKLGLILVISCFLIAVGSTAVAGEQIDEPDSWDNQVASGLDSGTPGDLKNISINYDEPDFLQFRINFSSDAPDHPLSSNVTQIYIDTGTGFGLDDSTYSGGGTTADFYDNLNTIDADRRISVGGGNSNVTTPWDEDTSQFDGTESEEVDVISTDDYVVVQVATEDIENPDEIDYKFVYIDTRNGIEGADDYTWAPDGDEDPLRFSLEDTGDTVPLGTINATVNISDTPAADGTNVDFSLSDGTVSSPPLDASNNISETFSVDSSEFNGDTEDTITATIDGENYTLEEEKTVDVGEGNVKNVTFEPYELINVTGEIGGQSGKEGTYSIELQDNGGNTIEEKTAAFSDAGAGEYEFTGISTAEFTSGGEVVASLESDDNPNTIKNDSDTNRIFSTARYKPSDVEVNFTVNAPAQKLTLTSNISEFDEFKSNRFNITVDASVDPDGDRIDSLKHVIEFDPAQIEVVSRESLINGTGNITDAPRSRDGLYETFIINSKNESSTSVVKSGATNQPVYNLTFEFVGEEPLQGDTASSENSVPIDSISTVKNTETELGRTRMVNATPGDNTVKEVEFTTDAPGTVDVYNTETIIEENDPFVADVNHLTTGGDMVGAPVKFDIPDGSVTSNDGKISRIVLRNNDTNTEVDEIECGGDVACGGELEHTPSNSTFLENAYGVDDRYNITAVPNGNGSNVTVEEPRGSGEGGQEIYKRADISLDEPGVSNDMGNVTLGGDVLTMLELRGQEAGGLPWEEDDGTVDIEAAQADVNNDGVIDIVDVTIVADEYEP